MGNSAVSWGRRLWAFLKWLLSLELALDEDPATHVRFTAREMDGHVLELLVTGETVMLLLTDSQKVSLAIQPVSAKGNPARVDGIPIWNNSNPTVGELVAAADGFSAVFTAFTAGATQIGVSADADLGAGVRTISGTLDIQIEPGEAVSLGIIAGVPEQQ